ncbi:glycosyl hydrolase family 18 protein [Cellulosimicrobium cellulans]|uniref:glycosyl hydrolase family 18 protein n=1 Tax=Cellulosimicrobium cellulans TaxID=1710 RepID=UPI001BADAA3D|nr:glycosyl hydrolase family 18 protein [Cellulosimicrobium cellulans]QUB99726.1 chitinase [Cellulosimicrobium cellulans]
MHRPRPSAPRRARATRAAAGLTALALAASGAVAAATTAAAAPTAHLTATTAATTPTPDSPNGDAALNGYRNVGYFMSWAPENYGYTVRDFVESGQAEQITHVNYAFGNIHPTDLTCFLADAPGTPEPGGNDGAGDAQADFVRAVSAEDSVDGVADAPGQALAGNFNQLRKLKEEHPDTKVLMSLGGWTWSKFFSKAAATPESREKFVASCIDLYIDGNLPVIDGRGGPGAAAGLFDGIDVDWEWPGAPDWSQHPENHVDPVNDKANFTALLAEFRKQLDERGAAQGKDYLLSAYIPVSPTVVNAGWDAPTIFDYLDYGNMQGYDLHGGWSPNLAGHQANLHDTSQPGTISLEDGIDLYLSRGVDPGQLTLGIPAFGRGWSGVEAGDSNGAWQPAAGVAPGTYEAGNKQYFELRDHGTEYFDEVSGASWRYDGDQWWSVDTPRAVEFKASWITEKGLGGSMFWDLAGDYEDELVGTAADVYRAAPAGPVDPTAPGSCFPGWDRSTSYVGGRVVSHEGVNYRAAWWVRTNVPGTEKWYPAWRVVGTCA